MRRGQSFSGNERNCCYLNIEGQKFENVSAVSGFDFPEDGRGLALVDWDQDGDLDVWLKNRNGPQVRYLENDFSGTANSLTLVLEGTSSNRDAIGARVAITLNSNRPRTISKSVRAGSGFLSQSSKRLHFGLGNSSAIKQIVVRWPNGKSQTFGPFSLEQINTHFRIKEDDPSATQIDLSNSETMSRRNLTASKHLDRPNRMLLSRAIPLPPLTYVSSQGENRSISCAESRMTLISFWAGWCQPCVDELRDLTQHREQLADLGVDILALSVDHLNSSTDTTSPVPEGVELVSGRATNRLMETFQVAKDYAHFRSTPFALPCSLLVDRNGIRAFYSQAVDVDVLRADLLRLQKQSRNSAMPFKGQWFLPEPNHRILWVAAKLLGVIADDELIEYLDANQDMIKGDPDLADARLRLGMRKFAYGQYDVALEQINQSIEVRPSVDAFFARGAAYQLLKQTEAATAAFEEASRRNLIRARDLHLEFAGQIQNQNQQLSQWHVDRARQLQTTPMAE